MGWGPGLWSLRVRAQSSSIVARATSRSGRKAHSPLAALALAACAALGTATARADVEPDAMMLRNPAISETRIAFVFANQLWTAPRKGGEASLVAAPQGRVAFPRFSPDGKTLAFIGNYDGNRDIYTLPLTGGVPSRVSHYPTGETLCNWTPDGKLLFYAGGLVGDHWTPKLFTVSPEGGQPEPLPVPYGVFGSINADGQWLAYTPFARDNATWKRYVGGTAPDVWLFNLKTHQSKKITDWEGTDSQPMWGYNRSGKTVYYLSDGGPEHRLNIWSYDTESSNREQITKFAEDDVKWPSIGPGPAEDHGRGEIIFQLGSKLMVLNLDSKQASQVHITVSGARPRLREQVKNAADHITAFGLSPSGKRALFTARGEIFSVPVKEGVARNLTNTPGANERFAAWSPDGRYIAYFSDAGAGENELYLRASDARPAEEEKADSEDDSGKDAAEKDKPADKSADKPATPPRPALKQPVKLTSIGPGFRFNPSWLPDSKHIVFSDNAGNLVLVTINFDGDAPKAELKTIDTDPWDQQDAISFTRDSKWVAYVRADDGNASGCVWLYNVDSGQKTRVTSPMFGALDVAFDFKGDYLYYRAKNDVTKPTYGDSDGAFVYAGTERFLLVPLRADVKNPFAPKSDEESIKADKKDEGKEPKKGDDGKADDAGTKPPPKDAKDAKDGKEGKDGADKKDEKKDAKRTDEKKAVKIDLDGFEGRAVIVPIEAGNFGGLTITDDGKLVYTRQGPRGSEEKPSLKVFDVTADEKEEKEIIGDCGAYAISDNGKKILAKVGEKYKLVDPVPGGGKPADVPLSGMRVETEPRTEWEEMFADAWRIMRDFFYLANMHGVDWAREREHYGRMIADCASREDVNYVIGELISELNVGHAYLWQPGEVDSSPAAGVGLLGCDFTLSGDAGGPKAYRITAIYHGAPWDADARGPFDGATPAKDRPKVGDYVLAVDGRPINTREDPWAAFVGLADRTITLTVSQKPTIDDSARDVLVKTVGSDHELRFRAWIERKRAYVAEKSGGKVGYIYVPNTGVQGQNELFRQFFGQIDRSGLIIDERWNGGGQIPWRFIELLNRPLTNYWAVRYGKDMPQPSEAQHGPKCMLINEQAGSGGDMFPWLFRYHKLGKLIGMRTWGGLVGFNEVPTLMDGGQITAPNFGFYKLDGTWGIEGHGVDPDIKIVDDPALMVEGGDPQLDAGIANVLEEIARNPPLVPKRPPSPDRTGMGIPERDR